MKIAIITKYDQPQISENVVRLLSQLSQMHQIVLLPELAAHHFEFPHDVAPYSQFKGAGVQAAVSIGGDGTMLGVVRNVVNDDIPVIGINQGRLGFITDIPLDDQTIYTVNSILSGERIEEKRFLLHYNDALALNDMVIQRANSKMLEFDVFVNQKFAYRCRADGFLISTPTGSTAYNLATGGSIVAPEAQIMTLTPLLSQTLSNRPLIVCNDSAVQMKIVANPATLLSDGLHVQDLVPGDSVTIQKYQKDAIFWHPKYTYNYLETLRTKLGWHHMS